MSTSPIKRTARKTNKQRSQSTASAPDDQRRELAQARVAITRRDENLVRQKQELEATKRAVRSGQVSLAEANAKIDALKRQVRTKEASLRDLRRDNQVLAKDLKVMKKRLSKESPRNTPPPFGGPPTRTQTAPAVRRKRTSKILEPKESVDQLQAELRHVRQRMYELLDSIRLRKKYYSCQIVKFKKNERAWISKQRTDFSRERIITQYVFPDQIQKITLNNARTDRVVISTIDGDVVVSPVEVEFVRDELHPANIDNPNDALGGVNIGPDDEKLDVDDKEEEKDEVLFSPNDSNNGRMVFDIDYDDSDEDARSVSSASESAIETALQSLRDEDLKKALEEMMSNSYGEGKVRADPEDLDAVYGLNNESIPEMETWQSSSEDPDDGWNFVYHVGDHVLLKRHQCGIIRFIGKTVRSHGETVYGIELIDGSVGKHNGSLGPHVYFHCPPSRGIFVREGSIRRKMRPKDRSLVTQREEDRRRAALQRISSGNISINLNMIPGLDDYSSAESSRPSSTRHSRRDSKGSLPIVLSAILDEAAQRLMDLKRMEGLVGQDNNTSPPTQAFLKLANEIHLRNHEFEDRLRAIGQLDDRFLREFLTYNDTITDFVTTLTAVISQAAMGRSSNERAFDCFLDELQMRTRDVSVLQTILFDRDSEIDSDSKSLKFRALLDEVSRRQTQGAEDVSNALGIQIAEEFMECNSGWRETLRVCKENHAQIDRMMINFADMFERWNEFWKPPKILEHYSSFTTQTTNSDY